MRFVRRKEVLVISLLVMLVLAGCAKNPVQLGGLEVTPENNPGRATIASFAANQLDTFEGTMTFLTNRAEAAGRLVRANGDFIVPINLLRQYSEISDKAQIVLERGREAVRVYLRAPNSMDSEDKLTGILQEIVTITSQAVAMSAKIAIERGN